MYLGVFFKVIFLNFIYRCQIIIAQEHCWLMTSKQILITENFRTRTHTGLNRKDCFGLCHQNSPETGYYLLVSNSLLVIIISFYTNAFI